MVKAWPYRAFNLILTPFLDVELRFFGNLSNKTEHLFTVRNTIIPTPSKSLGPWGFPYGLCSHPLGIRDYPMILSSKKKKFLSSPLPMKTSEICTISYCTDNELQISFDLSTPMLSQVCLTVFLDAPLLTTPFLSKIYVKICFPEVEKGEKMFY